MSNRNIKRIVNRGFDNVYSTALSMAKSFKSESIAISVLKVIINKAKLRNPKRGFKKHFDDINKILDQLLKTCESTANEMGSKHVSLELLLIYITEIKKAFNTAIDAH